MIGSWSDKMELRARADDGNERDEFMRGDEHSHDDHQLPLQVYHSWLKRLRRNAGCCERRRLRR
jgi:hypothetical protein